MGSRREAREIVMHVLYSIDVCNMSKEDACYSFWKNYPQKDILNIKDFIDELISGTLFNQKLIDSEIAKIMMNWDLNRVAAVDRAILRLATFELFFLGYVPINVVINEAVELAKNFSTNESGKFVNGILDKLKNKRGQYERVSV